MTLPCALLSSLSLLPPWSAHPHSSACPCNCHPSLSPSLSQDKKSATVLLGSCAVPAAKFLEVSGVVKADMSIVAVRGRAPPVSAAVCSAARPPSLSLPHTLLLPNPHAPPPAQSSISALGDSFDMDNYNKACELLPGFKSLF